MLFKYFFFFAKLAFQLRDKEGVYSRSGNYKSKAMMIMMMGVKNKLMALELNQLQPCPHWIYVVTRLPFSLSRGGYLEI